MTNSNLTLEQIQAGDPGRIRTLSARIFGPFGRYLLKHQTNRFGAEVWFVFDAEVIDEVTGRAAMIRQADTEAEALAGLPIEDARGE